jgi:hypothetical protein
MVERISKKLKEAKRMMKKGPHRSVMDGVAPEPEPGASLVEPSHGSADSSSTGPETHLKLNSLLSQTKEVGRQKTSIGDSRVP